MWVPSPQCLEHYTTKATKDLEQHGREISREKQLWTGWDGGLSRVTQDRASCPYMSFAELRVEKNKINELSQLQHSFQLVSLLEVIDLYFSFFPKSPKHYSSNDKCHHHLHLPFILSQDIGRLPGP